MLPLSPRNSEGTFHAVCTQSPDNLAPHADLRLASPMVNHGSGLEVASEGGIFVPEEFPTLERSASPLADSKEGQGES
ncbi:hypothetical protein V6N13_018797 [Hibiscus sabdariffa]